jgi:protoheme IX farnesyltransferase
MKRQFKTYYSLTKPGVLYGNVITAVAGFLLAAGYFKSFDLWLFLATIVGTTLMIASACVLNNFIDQDIDRIMERTKTRAIASGKIPGRNAVIFSIILCIFGITILALWVNWLVVVIGIVGFVVYVWLYGALSKRLSIHGALVGSISGAMPILAGYCAVSGQIDTAAVLVFLMVFFWQLPEFYSIAIYRLQEYRAADIPVMSVVKGVKSTNFQIYIYTILFVIATLLLTPLGYTGYIYFAVMSALGLNWIWLAAKGLHAKDSNKWARQNFHFSLIIILALSFMLSVGTLLP